MSAFVGSITNVVALFWPGCRGGSAMDAIHYKGFDLYPSSCELRDTGKWTMKVTIMKLNVARSFDASNTFETEVESLSRAVEFGRRIIDGEVPKCTVEDLL